MSEYFNDSEVCPKSRELLFHNTVATVRCGPCGLLNPNYEDSITKMPERNKALPVASQEIIEIDESPLATKTIANVLPPAKRRGLATHIPTIPNFKLGYAEKERQTVDQRIADRKSKTGFSSYVPIVHFNVGIAHFHHDNTIDDGGYWSALSSFISIDEENRQITSNDLTLSLLSKARMQAKRPNVKKWVLCGEETHWTLAHNNPSRIPARDIAPWADPKLISIAIDMGSYEQKPISGSTQKLVSIWLYFTPDMPSPSEPSTPSAQKPVVKSPKKEKSVKLEKKLKVEKNIKVEPTTTKRPRALSAEMSLAKRSGIITRKQAKAIEEVHDHLEEEDNEFPLIEDVIEDAEGSGGENPIAD